MKTNKIATRSVLTGPASPPSSWIAQQAQFGSAGGLVCRVMFGSRSPAKPLNKQNKPLPSSAGGHRVRRSASTPRCRFYRAPIFNHLQLTRLAAVLPF